MAAQLADAEVATPDVAAAEVEQAGPVAPPPVHDIAGRPRFDPETDLMSEDGRPIAARGIIVGVLMSAPLWALIGLTVYILV